MSANFWIKMVTPALTQSVPEIMGKGAPTEIFWKESCFEESSPIFWFAHQSGGGLFTVIIIHALLLL